MRFAAVRIGGHDSYGLRVFEGFKTGPAGELINVGRIAKSGPKGFTLVEILLVVVIIGIILAVVVPRAWRANVDAKYNLVRQAAVEMGSYALKWGESQLSAQDQTCNTSLNDYYDTLTPPGDWPPGSGTSWVNNARYVAWFLNMNNWNGSLPGHPGLRPIRGRNGTDARPETAVMDLVPPEKMPRNPFNGVNVFLVENDPASQRDVVPGALACAKWTDGNINYWYYAFFFQGTDCTTWDQSLNTTFHAGQRPGNMEGLRNGVFMARINK